MTDRTYIDPKTAEVKDATPRPFDEFIRELAEGATNSELSDGLWDLLQRVQDTGKAGTLSLSIAVGFDGKGRIQVKDEVKVRLPEFGRPTTAFFIDNTGNASRRDPNQPEIPGVTHLRTNREAQ